MYGDQQDWHRSTGTGPFILMDYVEGSTAYFEKNPNYWQYDPVHPDNRLPYVDAVRQLIIPDLSTRLASFRTGKLDMINAVTWEDYEILMGQIPEVQQRTSYSGDFLIPYGRVDDLTLPFHDINVRRAMNLAVDQQGIVDDYYQGNATLVGWPFWPIKAHEPFYTPLDQMPESVQELFTYNVEEAKRLLADAGYPNGFQTHIDCRSTDVDYLSIIKSYLAAVDIDMEIRPLESGNFLSLNRGRTHEQMTLGANTMSWGPWLMHECRLDSSGNVAMWEEPEAIEVYDIIKPTSSKTMHTV
jgi:peptide/nickel transport system substrate-binding protein